MAQRFFVTSIQDKSPHVRAIRFCPESDENPDSVNGCRGLSFAPGQYIHLRVNGMDERPFSLTANSTKDELEIYVSRHNEGMRYYLTHEISLGKRVEIDGPFGELSLPETGQPVLAIAGGTGLVPIYAIVENVLKSQPDLPLHFCVGAREEQDIVDLNELLAFKNDYPGTSLSIVLSEQKDHPDYACGFIHEHIEKQIDQVSNHAVLMAGPPPMISAVLPILIEKGLREENLHTDRANLSPEDIELLLKAR